MGGHGARGGGLIEWFAHNTVAANLIMLLMLVGGFFAGTQLTAQIFPTVDPRVVNVSVAYPGATPTEVEEGITRRVEEAVFGIDGVERVTSRASENVGTVTVELKDFVDASRVRDDVEAAVQRISDFPPEDAEQPSIVRAETISDVMTMVVASESSEAELRRGAELLEEALLALPSVSLVSLVGARDYEISIEVREEALRRHDLSIGQVANAVSRASLNLSSGELRTQGGDLLLRTNAKRERGEEFEDIVVRSAPDGAVLRLRDVANIRDGFADVDLIHQYNGRQSVFVQVRKSEAEDALVIAEDIKGLLADYRPPPGIDIDVWEDQTEILKDRISLLLRNGMLGFALVFLFLVVMLDLRLALWVAMGVPISFLGAFLFFDFLDVNINMVSLFALIMVIGIVVDDAVVVGENISSQWDAGHVGPEASIAGTRGVQSPVLVGVLTTMAAFAPLAFVTGNFGQILGAVPLVVVTVLAMSLVEAFFILPAHLAHPGTWSRWPLDAFQASVAAAVRRFRDNWLVPVIERAVRRRYMTLLGGSVAACRGGVADAERDGEVPVLPDAGSGRDAGGHRVPRGNAVRGDACSRGNGRRSRARAVNEDVGGTSMRALSVTVGGRPGEFTGPGGTEEMQVASHLAAVQVQLHREPLRTLAATELERLWRAKAGDVPGAERLTFSAELVGPGGADVEYELAHQDDATLSAAVDDLKEAYRRYPSMYEIQDSDSLGKRQYDIELTPAGEAAGLTPSDIARQLRGNFFGAEVHRIQRGRQELKVMVRYPPEQRQSAQDFFNVRVRLADGAEAPLSAVARVTESRGYSSINRVNGLRVVTVSGEVDTALATPTDVNARIQRDVLPDLARRYPGLQIAQAGFGMEQSRDLGALGHLTLVALMVIFALLASQLRSYVQPFIILAAVPFGAAGALIGHFLLGYDLSFISIFGMVALAGVVVNDSLVLVDRYNRLRRDNGVTPIEAVVTAARLRFRAVFLTTATTALGLTPMLFETSTQAQFLIPMAVSLATGIVFASVVILFLVPALVIIREDFHGETVAAGASGPA